MLEIVFVQLDPKTITHHSNVDANLTGVRFVAIVNMATPLRDTFELDLIEIQFIWSTANGWVPDGQFDKSLQLIRRHVLENRRLWFRLNPIKEDGQLGTNAWLFQEILRVHDCQPVSAAS